MARKPYDVFTSPPLSSYRGDKSHKIPEDDGDVVPCGLPSRDPRYDASSDWSGVTCKNCLRVKAARDRKGAENGRR